MNEHPKYVVMHGNGFKAIVLKRCTDDTCYTQFAEMKSISDARDLARKLNKAEVLPE